MNDDKLLTFGDVQAVFNAFKAADTTGAYDANMDGLLTFGDVQQVFNAFKSGVGLGACGL